MNSQKVLVVDDSKVARKRLAGMLKERAIEVHEADSGESGIDALKDESVDAVFLDLMMPGIDGYETLKRLQDDPNIDLPPVIICTADNKAIREQMTGSREPVLATLSKPYTSYELDSVLNRVYPPPAMEEISSALRARRPRSAQADVGPAVQSNHPALARSRVPTGTGAPANANVSASAAMRQNNAPQPVRPVAATVQLHQAPQPQNDIQDLVQAIGRLNDQIGILHQRLDKIDRKLRVKESAPTPLHTPPSNATNGSTGLDITDEQINRLARELSEKLRSIEPFANKTTNDTSSADTIIDRDSENRGHPIANWWRQAVGRR